MTLKYILITILLSIPILGFSEMCGDSLAVDSVIIVEIPIQDFNEGAVLKSKPRRRSRSLMIQEDESHPCDANDAFYLIPTRTYRIEFYPKDKNAYHKWALKIDYNSNMTFQVGEINYVEGRGMQFIDVVMPVYLRLKRTWLEFEMKGNSGNCSLECGAVSNNFCTILNNGIAIDAGAICVKDSECIPFDNITQYEYIERIQISDGSTSITEIKLCDDDTHKGYCSNFLDVNTMYGLNNGPNFLIIDIGYSGPAMEETVSIWFDENNDGVYTASEFAGKATGTNQLTLNVDMPNIDRSQFFTMRVKLENGPTSSGPCEIVEGETQDYIVLFNLND